MFQSISQNTSPANGADKVQETQQNFTQDTQQAVGENITGFGSKPLRGFGSKPLGSLGSKPLEGFGSKPLGGFGSKPLEGFGSKPLESFGSQSLQDGQQIVAENEVKTDGVCVQQAVAENGQQIVAEGEPQNITEDKQQGVAQSVKSFGNATGGFDSLVKSAEEKKESENKNDAEVAPLFNAEKTLLFFKESISELYRRFDEFEERLKVAENRVGRVKLDEIDFLRIFVFARDFLTVTDFCKELSISRDMYYRILKFDIADATELATAIRIAQEIGYPVPDELKSDNESSPTI
ncbi:MAG: hypothetical protein LBC82_03980 [Oscillospiraceae bacterium]|jgi:hypothetical protein|nr:hypothetical protein [Oscillospiraceae bacterium]